MIKDDFYPSNTDPGAVWPTAAGSNLFTQYIPDIPITSQDAPEAYWLGYVKYEDLPDAYRLFELTKDSDGMNFVDTTPVDNYDCGYGFKVPVVSGYTYYSPCRVTQEHYCSYGNPSNPPTYPNPLNRWAEHNAYVDRSINFCFSNAFDCMADGVTQVIIYYNGAIYDGGGNVVVNELGSTLGSIYFKVSEYIGLCKDGDSYSVDFGATYGIATFHASDFSAGVAYIETSTGYFWRVIITGYTLMTERRNNEGSASPSATPSFMARLKYNGNFDMIMCGNDTNTSGGWGYYQYDLNNNQEWYHFGSASALSGFVSWDTLTLINSSDKYYYTDRLYVGYISSNQWFFRPIFSLETIYKHLALSIRAVKYTYNSGLAPDYGYTNGDVWAPLIEDNRFTATMITGNLTNDSFKQRLQEWQYDLSEWDKNQYTEDDRPPYTPDPGDQGENIGDIITRPSTLGLGGTNKFITQYAMTASQVTELGELLWTSVFSADYWKNFMFSLALDTGSINISALLSFFISMRVYPFSMVNLKGGDITSNSGHDMYIGAGMMPLNFTGDLFTIDQYAAYLRGGECTIDSPSFYHDWRDYVNVEYTLFIPYCGTIRLNPGDVVGNQISVEYAIDFATGACIAYVDLKSGDSAGYPIAALPGQIGADIPLTATAAGQVAARLAGDAMNIAGLFGDAASREIGTATGALRGNIAPSAGSVGFALGGPLGAAAGTAIGSAPAALGAAVGILSHSAVQAPMLGAARGFASFGAPQAPFVQIRRGIYPDVPNYNETVGKPDPETVYISACTGLIKGDIITDGLAVQGDEAEAIRAAVSNGIIV